MNSDSNIYLNKTVFWQRIALAILSIFLLIMWGSFGYYIMDWMSSFLSSSSERVFYQREQFWFFLVWGFLLGVLTALAVVLYQGASALSSYLKTTDMLYLETAFRKQRHFWMGLTLSVVGCFGLVLLGIIFSIIR